MIARGEVLYLTDYQETKTSEKKPRYCIILEVLDNDFTIVFHKVTTQEYGFNHSQLNDGPNKVNTFDDIYFFPAKKVIGKNGFSFPKDCCILNGTWAISLFDIQDFQRFNPEKLDQLEDDIFLNIVYWLYKSDHTRRSNQVILEKVLDETIK